jgi:hypothetical protein
MNPFWDTESGLVHAVCLARCHRELTGRELVAGAAGLDPRALARAIHAGPFVVVSHGTEADPVLNYGNATALALWEMAWEEFVRTPSRHTAEAPDREERARLLARVTAHGFIDDYTGIRISRTGRRFRIERATVWNLTSVAGERLGQAATFGRWVSV